MNVVSRLKDWLTASEPSQRSGQFNKENIRLASALLMLEVGKADFELSTQEMEIIHQALAKQFHLSDDEVNEFVRYALEEYEQTVSAHDVVRILNESLSNEEKIDLLEGLWRIALVDRQLDKYEEYHIRKIADWLYVSHADFIRAKLNVSEEV